VSITCNFGAGNRGHEAQENNKSKRWAVELISIGTKGKRKGWEMAVRRSGSKWGGLMEVACYWAKKRKVREMEKQ